MSNKYHKVNVKYLIIMLIVIVTTGYTIPMIELKSQELGLYSSTEHFIKIRITNNDNIPVDNYTVGIVVNNSVGISSISQNFYVTDVNGNPLYYWLDSYSSNGFFFYVQVPHLNPHSYIDIIVRYGGENNPYPEYSNKSIIFFNINDFPFSDISNWKNYYSGIADVNKNFVIGHEVYLDSNNYLVLDKRMGIRSYSVEATLSPRDKYHIDREYTFVLEGMYNISRGYPLGLFISDNNHHYSFIGFYGYNSIMFMNYPQIVYGNYHSGFTYTFIPVLPGRWYVLKLRVSPMRVSVSVFDPSSSTYVLGWTTIDNLDSYSNDNIRVGIIMIVEPSQQKIRQVSQVKRFYSIMNTNVNITTQILGINSYIIKK